METGTCRYCLEPKKALVRSHLAPAALYDLCRGRDMEPIMFSAALVMSTSRQVQAPLLCGDCEGALNREGEDWTLPLLATAKGAFPFFDLLQKVPPDATDGEIAVYAAFRNPEIDVRKLTHFALGVFWKASVHPWSGSRRRPQIQLGPYGEEIRKFLRSEAPFPRYVALTVGVVPPRAAQISFCQPYEGSSCEFHHFMFYVPGIAFALSVGKGIGAAKETCFYSNPLHPVTIADLSRDIKAFLLGIFAQAHKSRSLLQYLEESSRGIPQSPSRPHRQR
jgi:hypothetical protein